MAPRNVRIWDWHPATCGLVKLTLRPGVLLVAYGGGRTDEGWHHWRATWELAPDGSEIYHTMDARGQDCDGRHSAGSDWRCVIDGAGWPDVRPSEDADGNLVMVARWQEATRYHRDFTAEAAGY